MSFRDEFNVLESLLNWAKNGDKDDCNSFIYVLLVLTLVFVLKLFILKS